MSVKSGFSTTPHVVYLDKKKNNYSFFNPNKVGLLTKVIPFFFLVSFYARNLTPRIDWKLLPHLFCPLEMKPAIGSTVILVCLANRSDLNGRRGIVHGFNCETARLQVKVDGEEAILSLKPQNLREVVTLGSGERGPFDTSHYILEPTADQWRVAQKVLELAHARDWKALFAMAGDAIQTAGELREAKYLESDDCMILGVDLQSCSGAIYNHVANSYQQLGECAKAIELFERALAIFKERGKRSDEAATYHGLGMCYQSLGEQSHCLLAG